MPDTISRGLEAEALVIAKLIGHGYHVNLPIAHNRPYDMIAENSAGEFKRIQVKRAHMNNTNKVKTLSVSVVRGGIPYAADDFDFMIACDVESNRFWVIPVAVSHYFLL